jgi:hypothetical protein
MAPQVREHLEARPTREDTDVDEIRIHPAGDPFTAKLSPASLGTPSRRLLELEDRLAHELMDDEERQELRDRILELRRSLG